MVDGIAHDQVAEKIIASASISGMSAEISAELLPAGTDPRAVADSATAEMSGRAGRSQLLLNGEPDVFCGDKPCRAYRFEWYPNNAGASAGHRPRVTHWIWIGDRAATIAVESPNPAAPWHALRDLVYVQ